MSFICYLITSPIPLCFVSPHTCSSGFLPTLGWSTSNVASDLRRRRKAALLPKRVARNEQQRWRLADKGRARMGRESFISAGGSAAKVFRSHGRMGCCSWCKRKRAKLGWRAVILSQHAPVVYWWGCLIFATKLGNSRRGVRLQAGKICC